MVTVELGWMVSGVLYVVLGFWVWTLTPRKPATMCFSAFVVLFGFYWMGSGLGSLLDSENFGFSATLALSMGSAAILGVAMTVPGPLKDHRLLWVALGISATFLLPSAIAEALGDPGSGGALFWAQFVTFWAGVWCYWAAALLIAFRASPRRDPGREEVVQLGILTVAFAFAIIFWVGLFVPQTVELLALEGLAGALRLGIPVLFWLLVAGVWGLNMLQAGPSTVQVHRAAMLSVLGVMLVGALVGAGYDMGRSGLGWPVVNALGVGLLAYGVLRHDIAGLDSKVEWGVSKTTVAGAFVAVFFVVGEVAETFFGDVLGDYIGIIAAGLLVFAISPLQRLADTIAARAVPGGAVAGHGVEDQYRAAVDMALADGEISREEERRLAEKADELGIDSTRAFELREEVEAAMSGGEA